MRLFLSSMAISATQAPAFTALVGKEPSAITLALIENAADVYDDDSVDWVDENRAAIMSHGYEVEIVDLRKYKSNTAALRTKLSSKDAIWLGGGNTYYLRWILRETGADTIIQELVAAGTVYGGGSAGALVAGPTIDYFQKADDPANAPEVILDGLHLTETVVVPHIGNEKYGIIMLEADKQLQANGYNTICIDDSQACIINGSEQRVL